MKLLVTGLNHQTAPVEVRERLAFPEEALAAAVSELLAQPGLTEGLILSTCNRVEVAVTAEDETEARAVVERFLAEARGVPLAAFGSLLYHYQDREAIRHLFRVAASLDSMIVGEPQILGQLKAAYAVAKAQGGADSFLDAVLTRAFSVAKRVRSETGIGESGVSVSWAAVQLAHDIFGSLEDRKVLLLGAGKVSQLAARRLHRSGVRQIFVANRTYERACEMAAEFQAVVVEYARFPAVLPEMDILLTSTSATDYLLRKNDMRKVMEARRNRPMFLIDIAVPRNIEPAVNELEGAFLYDIDDLEKVVQASLGERRKRAELAEQIVAEEVERMLARLRAREVVPTIVGLQVQLEQIRAAELERVRGKLGALTPQQEEALEALTRGLVNKIAHGPISELRRRAGHPDGLHIIEALRKAFRLES
jgi:glutamyl-tRNA reductase